MAVYPLITGPCPYQGRLAEIMDGDMCRMCKREVHDLSHMSDSQRRAFLKACSGEVCVSYRVAASTAAALTALAVAVVASPSASAQEPKIVVAKDDPGEVVIVTSAGRIAPIQDIAIAVVALVEDNRGNYVVPRAIAAEAPHEAPPEKTAPNRNGAGKS